MQLSQMMLTTPARPGQGGPLTTAITCQTPPPPTSRGTPAEGRQRLSSYFLLSREGEPRQMAAALRASAEGCSQQESFTSARHLYTSYSRAAGPAGGPH
jgi:hypothetical protein